MTVIAAAIYLLKVGNAATRKLYLILLYFQCVVKGEGLVLSKSSKGSYKEGSHPCDIWFGRRHPLLIPTPPGPMTPLTLYYYLYITNDIIIML